MVKKSVFLNTFGDTPVLRILDFLIVNEDFDYSMTDIAKFSGIGYSTLKLLWGKLETKNLIVQTRVVGKAKMFKLNYSNPIVKDFRTFYWQVTKNIVQEIVVEKVSKKSSNKN